MSSSATGTLLLFTIVVLRASAQTPTPPNPQPTQQLSPAAAYQEAIRPIEITHRSIGNWSLIEQSSLAVAIANAKGACDARKTSDYTADALMDLAQLCALAMNWPAVLESTDHYIREPATAPKTKVPEAYAGRVDAWLNLRNEKEALADAVKLLALTPYSPFAAQASSEAIDFMRFLHTADAVTLATQRNQAVLATLKSAPTMPVPIPVPDLYRQALTLAELQQLAADSGAAAQTIATLDALVPATITPDETLALANLRSRYTLLGAPLPSLAPRLPAPRLPVPGQITALLLFPDWCAQCLRLAAQIPQGPFQVEGHPARMFPLLVQTVPPQKLPPNLAPEAFNPAYAADALKSVSPILLTPAALETLHAADFPVLLLVDQKGSIRFMDVVDENALRPGNVVDSAVAFLGKPPAKQPSAAARSTVKDPGDAEADRP